MKISCHAIRSDILSNNNQYMEQISTWSRSVHGADQYMEQISTWNKSVHGTSHNILVGKGKERGQRCWNSYPLYMAENDYLCRDFGASSRSFLRPRLDAHQVEHKRNATHHRFLRYILPRPGRKECSHCRSALCGRACASVIRAFHLSQTGDWDVYCTPVEGSESVLLHVLLTLGRLGILSRLLLYSLAKRYFDRVVARGLHGKYFNITASSLQLFILGPSTGCRALAIKSRSQTSSNSIIARRVTGEHRRAALL